MADTIQIDVNGKPATVAASGQDRTLLEASAKICNSPAPSTGAARSVRARAVIVNGKRSFS